MPVSATSRNSYPAGKMKILIRHAYATKISTGHYMKLEGNS
ncbi:hypothetical protein X975_15114, partial [Stegodyphus mimosarum]